MRRSVAGLQRVLARARRCCPRNGVRSSRAARWAPRALCGRWSPSLPWEGGSEQVMAWSPQLT